MKALVVYDSTYGNTEKVARAISTALESHVRVEVLRVGDATPEHLAGFEILLVGSPTQGFRPTKPTSDLLKRIRPNGLQGIKVGAFDTRFDPQGLRSGALRLLIKTGGFAAERIAKQVKNAGGNLVVPPEGFFVEDTEGPLKPGELERAAGWAKSVLDAC